MKLKDFLDMYGIPLTSAAKRIRMSPQHLAKIVAGKHTPTLRLAEDISAYTQGVVSIDELTKCA